jgi:hypothetical protein
MRADRDSGGDFEPKVEARCPGRGAVAPNAQRSPACASAACVCIGRLRVHRPPVCASVPDAQQWPPIRRPLRPSYCAVPASRIRAREGLDQGDWFVLNSLRTPLSGLLDSLFSQSNRSCRTDKVFRRSHMLIYRRAGHVHRMRGPRNGAPSSGAASGSVVGLLELR